MATLPEVSSSCQSHLFPSRNTTTGTSTFHQNSREISLWVAVLLAEMCGAKLVPLMETGTSFLPDYTKFEGSHLPAVTLPSLASLTYPEAAQGTLVSRPVQESSQY